MSTKNHSIISGLFKAIIEINDTLLKFVGFFAVYRDFMFIISSDFHKKMGVIDFYSAHFTEKDIEI